MDNLFKHILLTNSGGGSVDPATIPLEKYLKIRGGLFTVRAPVSGNPRNLDPTNIAPTSGCEYRSIDEQAIIIKAHNDRRYTHGPHGPWIDGGYHEQHPATDFRKDPNKTLRWLQKMYDNNIIPVCYISPDNWTLAQVREAIFPIITRPEWKRVIRMLVPKGWEPSGDTPNSEYVEWFSVFKNEFPDAYIFWHPIANFDAPGNNDDLTPGLPTYIGNAECWRRIAPYIHGYLQQLGVFRDYPDNIPEVKNEFIKIYRDNRFKSGYAGWPTNSAFGPNTPIRLYYAEGTSYAAYWDNLPEEVSKAWGDLALQYNADGVLDGCNP